MRKFDLSGRGSIVSIVGRVEEVSIVWNALRNRNFSNGAAFKHRSIKQSNGEASNPSNLSNSEFTKPSNHFQPTMPFRLKKAGAFLNIQSQTISFLQYHRLQILRSSGASNPSNSEASNNQTAQPSNSEASNPSNISNGEAIKQLNLRIELNNKYNPYAIH